MNNYTKDQIRNKIATLQKSEKLKGSPNYKTLNLRQAIIQKQRKKSSSSTNNVVLRPPNDVSPEQASNLDTIAKMFRDVDPEKAFDGWFQLKVHVKVLNY